MDFEKFYEELHGSRRGHDEWHLNASLYLARLAQTLVDYVEHEVAEIKRNAEGDK